MSLPSPAPATSSLNSSSSSNSSSNRAEKMGSQRQSRTSNKRRPGRAIKSPQEGSGNEGYGVPVVGMGESEIHPRTEPYMGMLKRCNVPGVKCWIFEVLTAFGGPQRSKLYEQSVQNGSVVNVKEFAVDLRTRLCWVWSVLRSIEPRGHIHKRTTCHRWFASPLSPVSAEAVPYKAPRYLNLDLGRHVQQNISRFRLRTHTMGVERACWQIGVNGQDEKHVLFYCNCFEVCKLHRPLGVSFACSSDKHGAEHVAFSGDALSACYLNM
eukprot:1139621-Pelagomonas_calceolata.AAC.1